MCITALYAQTLDKEIPTIAGKLSKTLVAKGKKKVATIDFVDLQGRPTELGRFLAEQLSVELVNAEGMSVVDRANIKSILAEHKLSEEGLVNPENAKKLGQFAGVDAILIGTVTPLDDSIVLTVKAVSTDTAEVVAAGKVEFRKTSEIQQLLVHGVTDDRFATSTRATSSDTAAIATEDLGDLRVVLKSMQPVNTRNGLGLRARLGFINRNIKEPLQFAANAEATGDFWEPRLVKFRITDSSGNTFVVNEAGGLSAVHVYINHDPAAIANYIMYGSHIDKNNIMGTFRVAKPWLGDFIVIPAGEDTGATIVFTPIQSSNSGGVLRGAGEVQFEGEIVVGIGRSYRLYNLMWDKINISRADK
jgi:curli biogenesis system outer membrane secretion channel CsgG